MKQKKIKSGTILETAFFHTYLLILIFFCSPFFKAIESFQTESISTTAESSSTKESKSTEDIDLTEEINPSALPLTAETPPAPQKLVGNSIRGLEPSIPTMVTEVPAIEVPTKFEDLLEDPRIVFKSVSGNWENVREGSLSKLLFELACLSVRLSASVRMKTS